MNGRAWLTGHSGLLPGVLSALLLLAAGSTPGSPVQVTMQQESVPVRAVLQMLAQTLERDLIIAPEVTGSTSVAFTDLPADQAWQALLRSQGLQAENRNGVWQVRPGPLPGARTNQADPVASRVVPLAHSTASHLADLVRQQTRLGASVDLAADDPGARLLLVGPPEALDRVAALIRRLDQPAPQILLESRIVLAQRSTLNALGVNWQTGTGAPGNGSTVGGAEAGWRDFYAAARRSGTSARPDLRGILQVPLGVQQEGAARFGFGIIHQGTELDLTLSALASTGQLEIVSAPRLLTTSGHAARIASGTSIPFPGADGATEFVDAVLSVEATPRHIGAGQVGLVLDVQQDSPAGSGSGNISTNSLSTRVRVQSGDTLVLGGLNRQEQSEQVRSVPGLGRLPWVGRLFRHRQTRTVNNELVIMITPRLLD